MARKRDKIKELGDQKLVSEIEKLQNQIALEQDLDKTTLDLSDDNYIPVLFNEDEEVISYIGYDSETGYELILP